MAKKLSKAGARTEQGILTCPKCGGTSFKSKRSGKRKLLAVPLLVVLPLVPKNHVRCEACGETFKRG